MRAAVALMCFVSLAPVAHADDFSEEFLEPCARSMLTEGTLSFDWIGGDGIIEFAVPLRYYEIQGAHPSVCAVHM